MCKSKTLIKSEREKIKAKSYKNKKLGGIKIC